MVRRRIYMMMKSWKMFDDADCLVEFERLSKRNKIISSKKKRRFSDEQIRCLELMFESETKLEAGKKAEVARELGLQPRQIAIWFQNRRARWKSKKIESDYSLLLSEYNSLSSQFESLKKDNHSLLSQLQKLKERSAEVAEAEAELVKMSDSDELITQPSQSYQWWDLWG